MKKLTVLFSLLFLGMFAHSQDLSKAEKLFDKGDFSAALPLYQQLAQSSDEKTHLQAQLRVAACQYGLGEYLNAAKTMLSYPLPSKDDWKARFLLYRIQTSQQASGIYRPILEKREIASAQAAQDPEYWTSAQWKDRIQQDYEDLWTLKNTLIQLPTAAETLILNTKDTDLQRIPTLFDFTVQNWLEDLSDTPSVSPSPRLYLNGYASVHPTAKEKAEKRASILQTAYTIGGKNRQNAQVFWQTDYILLPFTHEDYFTFSNKEKAVANAIEQLRTLAEPKKSLKLQGSHNATAYGRSYALFQAAELAYRQDLRTQALQLCQSAQTLPRSYYTDRCKELAQDITRPTFSFSTLPPAIVPNKPLLPASARNIERIYGRIYPVTIDDLKKFYNESRYNRNDNSWSFLSQLSSKTIETLLSGTRTYTPFSQNISYQKAYFDEKITLSLPALSHGFYIVLASAQRNFNPQESAVYGIVINSSDLAVFTTAAIADRPDLYTWTLSSTPHTYNPDVFHFYTVDLKTGQAVPGASLDVRTGYNGSHTKLSTNNQGYAALARSITAGVNNGSSYFVEPLAHAKDSYAYTSGQVHFSFYNSVPVTLFAQTDRAIYRPGQKVQLSVQAFQKVVRGTEVLPRTPLSLKVRNAAGDTIFTTSLTTNDMGTAQTQFTLPDNNPMLGYFHVEVNTSLQNKTYTGHHSFQVEEYKRPDYEITLDDPQTPLAYGKQTAVTGTARYYVGTPLQNATVHYTVTRQDYVPPFYWWYYRPYTEPRTVAQGQTRTDSNGSFRVPFTPTLTAKDESFALYRVHAEVLDDSGRAIETIHSYKVSLRPHLFKVTFAQGFYDAATPISQLAQLDLTDTQGKSTDGKIAVRVSKLVAQTQAPQEEQNTFRSRQEMTLEKWYADAPEEKSVFSKDISFAKPGAQTLSLPALEEGVYRLRLRSPQADEQNLVFVVVKDGKTLSLPDVALVQHKTYYPGETARLLVGSHRLPGTLFTQFYTQGQFLLAQERHPGGVRVIERSITQQDRGGIALRWFGAGNYEFHSATALIEVPFDNKELTVSVDAPATILPGQEVKWTVSAQDSAHRPVNGQASLSVYDKSLDYYVAKEFPFSLSTFFHSNAQQGQFAHSRQSGYTYTHFLHNEKTDWLSLLPLPSLNLVMSRHMYGSKMMMARAAGAPKMMALEANMAADFEDAAFAEAAVMDDVKSSQDSASTGAAEEPEADSLRTDFAETAYFNTLLPVTNGKATASFKFPDSLTTWNVMGYVLTPQTDMGTFNVQTISRKDFMVRLQLPRFYREGDHGVFQAAVTNLTSKKITVPVTLTVRKQGTPVHKDFGLTVLTKAVTVPPQETIFATWNINVPHAPDVYQLTASAKSFQTSDGEQKDFLVLPGTTRLLATAHSALKNGNNTLTLTELENNPSFTPEVASLQLHPSLALSVLNSMPNILMTPYKDLVSSLNRYVPLAVVHQFYTTYPQLKQAVKKLPKRTGLTAPWNEKDPLRLTLLEQTPWTYQARGRQQNTADLIDLFNDKIVTSKLENERKQIQRFQNSSGAFTWFVGGPDDDYLTLYALEAFAQALHYGAPIPEAEAKKAFQYIVPRIEKYLKEDKEGSERTVSFALYAAYVLSSFPPSWPQYQQAKPYIKKWADYADTQSRHMTALGQTYAAAVYHRLGDDVLANTYLDKVLSRMKTNELTGAYFAPEAQSWVWYRDTLSTQTLTLRTLLEIRPNSDKIDPMLQWLLFNRQANEWHSSKDAAQAVFTIMDVMQAKGALTTPSTYTLSWAGKRRQLTFEPLDWTQDLQWVKKDQEISTADYKATISKQGKTTDFASLAVVYRSAQAQASPKGVINVSRQYFVRFTENGTEKLRPVEEGGTVKVGDEVEVHLTLTTDSAFEYVLLDDPKPAGFESEDLLSQWTWDQLSFYREIRDAQTRFFIHRLPAGKVTLRYVLRPTVPGEMHVLPAQLQSMYAPQYGAHTQSTHLRVTL